MFTNKRRNTTILHIFIIVAVGLILSIPILSYGCLNAHDIQAHLPYSKHFADQLWQGDLYPRWLQNMNAGLGSPTFFFYPPVPYYFTSLFYLWTKSSCTALALSNSLALIASGLTAYLWLRTSIKKNWAPLIASIVYMAWPYHLYIDLYKRLAFGEHWSFVWLPLILFFTIKIIDSSNKNVFFNINIVGLAVTYALLSTTHLPTFVIFFPIPIGYIFVNWNQHRHKVKLIFNLIIAIIVSIGLSAIFWLPAMTTQEYISMYIMSEKYFSYANNFIFSNSKYVIQRPLYRYIEVLTILSAGFAFSAFSIARGDTKGTQREIKYWLFIAILAIFMILPLSQPIWYILPPVQKLQFSWRFNVVVTFANTALFAWAISSLKDNVFNVKNKIAHVFILLAASIVLSAIQCLPLQNKIKFLNIQNNAVPIIAVTFFIVLLLPKLIKPLNSYAKKVFILILLLTNILVLSAILMPQTFVALTSNEISEMLEVSAVLPEHKTKWAPKTIFTPENLIKLGKDSPQASIDKGEGSVSIKRWQPRNILLDVNAKTDISLTVHQFYYPGWTAKLKDKSQIIPTQPSELNGLLEVSVPAGNNQVLVTLEAGKEEYIGRIVTAISSLIALMLALYAIWNHRAKSVKFFAKSQS
ncbi:hypothetical protein LC607_11425 [Nostoc sp. CHAB 5824]|nr:hypothetical protein [Nostoc sp. CHAB 5824]